LHFCLAKDRVCQLSNQYGEEKKSYLQRFGKIDLSKSKKGNPAAREGKAHAGVARETECQANRKLAYMPIHPRILSS
jgi:hypothetical protein